MRYRVYFNRFADDAQAWSVDDGEQANEVTCRAVVISTNGNRSSIQTMHRREEGDNVTSPTAWLEVVSSRPLTIKNGIVYIKDEDASYE